MYGLLAAVVFIRKKTHINMQISIYIYHGSGGGLTTLTNTNSSFKIGKSLFTTIARLCY